LKQNYINYINGTWEDENNSSVPIYDGGFLLGDGLFETIRFDNKNIFSVKKHLNRLYEGLSLIRIKLNIKENEIISLLEKIVKKNSIQSGLLRLMITRGKIEGAPWKYMGPPGIYITIRPFTNEPNLPVKIIYYNEKKYPIIRFTPAIKSLNYIGNMLAKKDAEKEKAYEPVFYNHNGFITECAIRNIFYISNNKLLTPSTSLGVLPGVMRDTIISISKNIGLTVEETNIPIKSINKMDEAFISSTGIGLLPCTWDGWNSKFKKTYELKKLLDSLIHNKDLI